MRSRSPYRWFPWSIAGIMTLVVAVNLGFVYFAFSSSPGLVTEHPYDQGNGYNTVLNAAAQQDALGWVGKIAFAPRGNALGKLSAAITDRAGKPLPGLSVTAHIERPIEPLPKTLLPLRASGDGTYRAEIEFARPGQWEVRIIARLDDKLYEFSDRIFVK